MSKIKFNYESPKPIGGVLEIISVCKDKEIVIVCIGSDRSIGDSVGPLVGTMLTESKVNFDVYGTIHQPIHALNLEKRMLEIKNTHPNAVIIGVDASLGNDKDIGQICYADAPIRPGRGLGKNLMDVGEISIAGIVDSSDNNQFFTNRTIRLSFVMDMARAITDSLVEALAILKGSEEFAAISLCEEVEVI